MKFSLFSSAYGRLLVPVPFGENPILFLIKYLITFVEKPLEHVCVLVFLDHLANWIDLYICIYIISMWS